MTDLISISEVLEIIEQNLTPRTMLKDQFIEPSTKEWQKIHEIMAVNRIKFERYVMSIYKNGWSDALQRIKVELEEKIGD